MGNAQGSDEAERQFVGYRVLGVQQHSPAAKCGLVSFFDFIVAANGVPLRSLDTTFIEIIKASENKSLPITVYNCKAKTVREVSLVPSRSWPGEGMLGVVIRFDTYHEADENVCHVLDVEINSPAELAGLQPITDYLLGTAEAVFKSPDILQSVLEENLEQPIEFYVYSSITDEVRTVIIMPTEDWGGEGILGAGIGYGYLHAIPRQCCGTLGISTVAPAQQMRGDALQSAFGVNDIPTLSWDHLSPAVQTTPESEKNLACLNSVNQTKNIQLFLPSLPSDIAPFPINAAVNDSSSSLSLASSIRVEPVANVTVVGNSMTMAAGKMHQLEFPRKGKVEGGVTISESLSTSPTTTNENERSDMNSSESDKTAMQQRLVMKVAVTSTVSPIVLPEAVSVKPDPVRKTWW